MSKHANGKSRNYGSGGGLSKHRKSGHATKSPKLRMKLKMEAEKNEKKAKEPITKKLEFKNGRFV